MSTQAEASPLVIIVDDDEEDVFALRRAFTKHDPAIELLHLSDGASAMDYLLEVKEYHQLPDLVLLDINMPRIDGFETLEALRRSDLTRHLPVLMFSTSDSIAEVRRAYSSGANAHLVKPSSMSQLTAMVGAIRAFWLETAELPNRS